LPEHGGYGSGVVLDEAEEAVLDEVLDEVLLANLAT
jgi:hypothetical protein